MSRTIGWNSAQRLQKPRGELNWQQVVISLQTLLRECRFTLARTGLMRITSCEMKTVHLTVLKPPAAGQAEPSQRFVYHNSATCSNDPTSQAAACMSYRRWTASGLTTAVGHRPPTARTAYLEADELPRHESFIRPT